MRQDPPFDMAYITATHILERIHPKTLVVNDPFHVRNAPEKLFVTHFEGVMPPTLITSDREEIRAFRADHKDIVLKPLYGNGGAGVFRVKPDDENLNALLEMFTQFYREPVVDFIEDFTRRFPGYVDDYETLLTENRIWKQRTVGIGVVTAGARAQARA